MDINITTDKCKLTPAIKSHLEHALAPLQKHFHPITTPIHITLRVENFQHIAEGHMHLPRHKDIMASCTTKDMYASIDLLAKKLDQQVIEHKNTMKD
jgi:ribosome hibernation promoting factor